MAEDKKAEGISLPDIPKDKEYEDYVAAILQSGGYYLERGIIHRIKQDVLELDIVSTKFSEESIERSISEIKSGGWGFPDIFKVRGWLDYLNLNKATFIIQEPSQFIEMAKLISKKINVTLINNGDLNRKEILDAYAITEEQASKIIIEAYRYAFALESEMILYLHARAKSETTKIGFKALEKYIFEINCNSFFESTPVDRIKRIFQAYTENKNITARIAKELENKTYPENGDGLSISESQFNKLFYEAKDISVLYVALYAELLTRMSILKTCIEDILVGTKDGFVERLKHYTLPANIRDGLRELQKDSYSYLYPYFWQVFIYLFGGFILDDKKVEEYQLLSSITNIPIGEIPKAFKAFDVLFPLQDGKSWLIQQPNTRITLIQFFPLPLSGIGAYFRRLKYKKGDDDSYENLAKQLTGKYTIEDIVKWNNLAYHFLERSARKKK